MIDESIKQEKALINLFKKLGIKNCYWPKRKSIEIEGKDVEIDGIAIYKNLIFLLGATLQNEKNSRAELKKFFKNSQPLCENKNSKKLKEYLQKIGVKKRISIDSSTIYKKIFWAPELNRKYAGKKNKEAKHEKCWNDDMFNYFKNLGKCIGEYGKYELFGFFDIEPAEIDENLQIGGENHAEAILLDKKKNFSLYICRIKPSFLVKVMHVLRKDGWSIESYQRVLNDKKLSDIAAGLKKMRGKFVIFPTNIVASFIGGSRSFEHKKDNYGKLLFPKKFNSVSVIDGQHRLYSLIKLNRRIKKIEAFGYIIVFDERIKEQDIVKQQAKTFVDINEKQTPVSKDVIYPIAWNILDRRDTESFCSKLLIDLEEKGILKDKIKLKYYQKNPITIVSIVRYGLKKLINFETDKKGIIYLLCDTRVHKQIKKGNFSNYLKINFRIFDIYFKTLFNYFGSRKGKELTIPNELLRSTIINGFIRSLEDILIKNESVIKDSIKNNKYNKISKIFEKYIKSLPKRKTTFYRKAYISSKGWSNLKEDLNKHYKKTGLL